jgi:hypothetical protein
MQFFSGNDLPGVLQQEREDWKGLPLRFSGIPRRKTSFEARFTSKVPNLWLVFPLARVAMTAPQAGSEFSTTICPANPIHPGL